MPVLTINGPIGCGSVTVGQLVAQKLEINFIDRLVLTEASKLVRAPVWALMEKEQRRVRFRDRLGKFMQAMLERSAISDEMYVSAMAWSPEVLGSLESEPRTSTTKVTDNDFIDATTTVVKDLYRKGNVVIVGRGANVILGDSPGVFHVGLLAPSDVRAETLMRRENLERKEAEVYVEELELARVKYFRRFFEVHPDEPGLYNTILNMGTIEPETAANMIVRAVEEVTAISSLSVVTPASQPAGFREED